MTIETKYNVGDEVFIMKDNKVRTLVVNQIKVTCFEKGRNAADVNREYTIFYLDNTYTISENECFKTKEELLASL